ncbi:type II and III secretion system protein family protein [Massilia arenosa]|uniref:Type II and III secretion system protein family protein n=1 Tax=Zemynaea arenosa TaxID=2561931 RepID=A0A4Y9S6R8_9BURK|nr:type II and III secretion system protein family protein [Massilia arenosa]TFW17142.1 type II and III secretion system protein family protein [Massilia arenosa]
MKAFLISACALAVGHAMAAPAAPAASSAKPETAQIRTDVGPRCTGQSTVPAQLPLQLGRSTLMRLPEAAVSRSVGNPAVAQAMLVAPDTMYVVGVDIGSTNMIVQGRSGKCSVIDITVGIDTSALQAALAQAMPDEKDIRVLAAADSVVLSGTVADGAAVARAGELASAFVRRPATSLLRREDAAATNVAGNNAGASSNLRVVNLLNVSAPQQVMLEVKVAEVSKSLLERLEAGTNWQFSSGSWVAALVANFLTGTAHGGVQLTKGPGKSLALDAQKQDALVRILAEPNVMAISGQEGSFLAGGRFYIPVAQDNNKITLEEKEFGVGLRFTPTVMAGGRISLRVAPEVSELSRDGIGISANGLQLNAVLPLLTTRRASTTVQLYDGQSFAIGGLIKNNAQHTIKAFPVLGEIPVLGALFRSTDYQQDKTELVFVVTAHLVKPLAGTPPLPTERAPIPGRTEFMLGGKLEGAAPAAPAAAPAVPAAVTTRPSGFETQ